jgi:ATP-dependent Lon protease
VLAAKRAGIETIIMPEKNRKDLEEIPKKNIKDLNFQFINDIDEVIDYAIVN